jgi:NodT family efflux transporter outer membrane factor (OMF) lipoprotein
MATLRGLSVILLVLTLAGCTVGPSYKPPTVAVPSTFSAGTAATSARDADWWKAFNDPILTALLNRALVENPDVQEAVSRIRLARQQERIERGSHGPQINASAQAATTRLSKNALPSAFANLFSNPGQSSSSAGLGLPGETFTTYQTGFDASWELDLFGGQRRSNEAARARTEAAIWSGRDAEVMLTAEVANTYQQYRALQRRIALADETLATQRAALEFIQVRSRNGLVSDSDERRQERELEQNAAQREDLAAQANIHVHALAALLGMSPTGLEGELSVGSPPDAPNPVEVPPGLPSDLLQRRPDLRAAERQVAAATADVGVATADLYPKFSLTGAVQLASRSLSTILEGDSLQDNGGGRLSLPLLNRARLHANVQVRQEQVDQAVLEYRKAVLSALRDVEDSLSRLEAQRRKLDQLRAAALAAQDEADTATVRYHNGLTPAGDMLAARQTWQLARDAQIQAETDAVQDTVALYKALGGGWDEHEHLSKEDTSSGPGR